MRPSFASSVRPVAGKQPLIFCRKSTEAQIACHALLLYAARYDTVVRRRCLTWWKYVVHLVFIRQTDSE